MEVVSLVLRALAPSQEENLWEAVTESRQLSTGCDVKEAATFAGLQRMHQ